MAAPILATATYNGSFGMLLAERESTEGTLATLTKADAIPVFKDTMTIDLGFSMEQPLMEDPYGTAYQGQLVNSKPKFAFEAPLYGKGISTYVTFTRLIDAILQTCGDVVQSSLSLSWIPTMAIPQRTPGGGAAAATGCSFSLAGTFGLIGTAAGGGTKLSCTLVDCKVTTLTFMIKAGAIMRVKVEGIGLYNAPFVDQTIDLSGSSNWDTTAADFILSNGIQFELDTNPANATAIEIKVDFGAEHIASDAAAKGVGGVMVSKRDVSINIDPVWLPTADFSPYTIAAAGGTVLVSSGVAYPQSRGVAGGYGVGFQLPSVQFANPTVKRGAAVRQTLAGVATKTDATTSPLIVTWQ